MDDLTIEKIKTQIKENLRRARERQPSDAESPGEVGSPVPPMKPEARSRTPENGLRSQVDGFLWRYGTQYARLIKSIPILRNIAERHYRRLNYATRGRGWPPHPPGSAARLSSLTGPAWNYAPYIEDTKREGIKGRLKRSIFKLIGFFAWWQEQINAAVHRELMSQRTEAAAVRAETQRLQQSLEMVQEERHRMTAETQRLQQSLEMVQSSLSEMRSATAERSSKVDALRQHLVFIARKLDLLNHELKKRAGLDVNAVVKELSTQEFSPEAYRWFEFENAFRGSRALIGERQSQYIDYVLRARDESKGSYLLDLGCGRGEFMEVLKERGVPSLGVDLNEENVTACRERGLKAELTDALQFLVSVKSESLIGVTAFQVVEHLSVEYLIELISTVYERVRPGGVLILETVNPFSLFSLRNFYLDLTHRNPIPPDTLKYLAESAGFRDVEVRYSSPVPAEMRLEGDDDNTRKLNDLLFGFQDYAVIGWK